MISIAKSLFIKKGEYLQVRLFVSFFDRLVFGPHMTRRVYLCTYLLFSTDGMISIRLTIYNFQARLFGKLDFIQF